jgi:hypothetical protein
MALRRARLQPGRRALRQAAEVSGVALLLVLGGCSPIETYRSLSGVAKNDPDPQTALFTQNLAAADVGSYPNLASVPPPPIRATSTAERQKLTQSLIADRTATTTATGPAPPTPSPSPSKGSSPGPIAATPAATPPAPPAAATATPPAAATATPPAPTTVTPPAAAAATPPAATPPHGQTALASNQSGRRKEGEPPEPGPPNSTLQMPDVRSVPQPEPAQPAPSRPALAPVALPAPEAAVGPSPAAIASAAPEPALPVPVLAPIAPPPAPVKPPPKPVPAATTVATLAPPPTPDGQEQAQIAKVASLYRTQPGSVRVVAYAVAPIAGGDPLASYHAALDRAQAVAKALAAAGVPADKIQTQATPAGGAGGAGRVEIQLAP